jgi:hypothetical protein
MDPDELFIALTRKNSKEGIKTHYFKLFSREITKDLYFLLINIDKFILYLQNDLVFTLYDVIKEYKSTTFKVLFHEKNKLILTFYDIVQEVCPKSLELVFKDSYCSLLQQYIYDITCSSNRNTE